MRRSSFLLAAMLAASACASPERTTQAPPRSIAVLGPPPTPSQDVVANAPVADAGAEPNVEPVATTEAREPDPPADYTSFKELTSAGQRALGKTALLSVRRDHYTSATEFTGVGCAVDRTSAPAKSIRLLFTRAQRDYVRALFPAGLGTGCAKVLVRLRSVDARINYFTASIERFIGAMPRSAAPPPPGADYATIDDAALAGAETKGKIIDANVWVYDGNPQLLSVQDCRRTDVRLHVVAKTAAVRKLTDRISRSAQVCSRARLRVVDPAYRSCASDGCIDGFLAEVIEVP